MYHTEHGFTQGFLSALNRCMTTSFFTAPHGPKKEGTNHPGLEMVPRCPKIIAQERYLAIPTFIRQGKNLGL